MTVLHRERCRTSPAPDPQFHLSPVSHVPDKSPLWSYRHSASPHHRQPPTRHARHKSFRSSLLSSWTTSLCNRTSLRSISGTRTTRFIIARLPRASHQCFSACSPTSVNPSSASGPSQASFSLISTFCGIRPSLPWQIYGSSITWCARARRVQRVVEQVLVTAHCSGCQPQARGTASGSEGRIAEHQRSRRYSL